MERYASFVVWLHDMGYTWHDMHALTTLELMLLQLGQLVRRQEADAGGLHTRNRQKAAYRRHFGYD